MNLLPQGHMQSGYGCTHAWEAQGCDCSLLHAWWSHLRLEIKWESYPGLSHSRGHMEAYQPGPKMGRRQVLGRGLCFLLLS